MSVIRIDNMIQSLGYTKVQNLSPQKIIPKAINRSSSLSFPSSRTTSISPPRPVLAQTASPPISGAPIQVHRVWARLTEWVRSLEEVVLVQGLVEKRARVVVLIFVGVGIFEVEISLRL